MSEMIERVARAMWENHRRDNHIFGGPYQDDSWSDLIEADARTLDALEELARAAIAAMREPTDEMAESGRTADCRNLHIGIDDLSSNLEMKWRYIAMINEALK